MQRVFDTPEPPVLFVEIGSGQVHVTAADVEQTSIEVVGPHADEVTIEQRKHEIVVVAARRTGFLGGGKDLRVTARVPIDTELSTRLGSADLTTTGQLGWVKLDTGSGDIAVESVSAEALIKAGSGDIAVERIDGPANVSAGSGDIRIRRLGAAAQVSSGSGDIEVGYAAAALSVKSGSGDLTVVDAGGDVLLSTASGDLEVGRFPAGKLTAKNVSGDIRIGIPAGVPVWTDISSTTGRVTSNLRGSGQPTDGQEYVELRARTVSGDVLLEQIQETS